jgi:DNA-binding transcriptional regulator YdaS (Cro superfamily)
MPAKDYKTRLEELRTYCEAKRGRKVALARSLGVTHMLVTRWLRGTGMVTSEQWIAIEKIIQQSEGSDFR